MPGRQDDIDCITAALADGTLSRDAARESVSRVVRTCRELGAR